jgi:hypothetical protein
MANNRGAVLQRKQWGGDSREVVRGSFRRRPGVAASGLHLFYHLHEFRGIEYTMANAIGDPGVRPESNGKEYDEKLKYEEQGKYQQAGGSVLTSRGGSIRKSAEGSIGKST